MKHTKNLFEAGKPLLEAKNAMIMLHGRGASAQDILSLRQYLPLEDFYMVAPQATNHTWYPYSFMAPVEQNQPWLDSALELVTSVAADINNAGLSSDQIFILGFSQGACLSLEFATRHAQRWGGVIAFTGGLIGDQIHSEHYQGKFDGTPVFISNSNNDPHVPISRSEDTRRIMEEMGARVSLNIYPNRPHTILQEELELARGILTRD